jgi:hypothetical protein
MADKGEPMKTKLGLSAFATAMLFNLGNASHVNAGGTYSTSMITAVSGEFLQCLVSNVGTSEVDIAVTLVSLTGAVVTPNIDNCTGIPLAAGRTCNVNITGTSVRCVVESSSSKIRAALLLKNSSTFKVTFSVPATKK